MKGKKEVKLKGIVIGYTYDEGKTIEFLDNDEVNKIKTELFKGQDAPVMPDIKLIDEDELKKFINFDITIGVSSRQTDIRKAIQDFVFSTIVETDKELLEKSIQDTADHKAAVFSFMERVCDKLLERAALHDNSKFSKEEAPYYAKAKDLRGVTYGTDEYFKQMKETLSPALDHHYKHNRHHPEFHKNGFQDMSWIDKIEMLVDWKASTKRSPDGDIKKSIEINQERFSYSDKDKEDMIQFLKDINLW